MKYVLFLLLSLGNLANAATVMEWQEATFTNLLKNPGFENGSAKWTPSVSSTFQIVSGTQALIETRSASFTATAASQTVQTALYAIPKGLANGDCESQILYQTNSNVYRMRVLNASGVVIAQQPLPAVSSSSVAKMFFPCSLSGSTSLRSDLISSATAGVNSITWDQNHLGSLISSKNGAVVGPWAPYTVGCSGSFTTNTTYSCRKRQVGDMIEYEYRLTFAGAPNATTLSLNLPDTIDANKISVTDNANHGLATINDTGVQNYIGRVYTAAGATNTVQVAVTNSNTAYGLVNLVSQTIPFTIGSGDTIIATFRVPIVGLTGSSTTFDSVCPNDISCTNEFSAFIGANGAVSGENLDWIASCTNANSTVCTLNTGVFSVVPVCNAAIDNLAGEATVTTISPTSIAITTYNSGGAATALAKVVKCSKQGADFKAKQTIEGFMSKTVTSTGNFIERMERASVNSNCSASPCTISFQSGAFASITRAATGAYAANFVAGTWASTPACFIIPYSGSPPLTAMLTGTPTTTTVSFNTFNTSNSASTDTAFNIVCHGPR